MIVPTLETLTTEAIDPTLSDLDLLDTEAQLRRINDEDAKVAAAVEHEIPQIAAAVRLAAASLRRDGRLIYLGAGTSGRLGVLDASECPPTFGVAPESIVGIIAGGPGAMFQAVEGAEDDPFLGAAAIAEAGVSELDTVVGISASGQAPFVLGAMHEAKNRGAATVGIATNRPSALEAVVDVMIAPVVGPEVLAGSTRLKSGTAQKLALNMISTGAMIEIGKTFGNLMVDVQATNSKLQARAVRIVRHLTGASAEEAERALSDCGGSAKIAIVLLHRKQGTADARRCLAEAGGFLRAALIGK